jgi:hypothetical protein
VELEVLKNFMTPSVHGTIIQANYTLEVQIYHAGVMSTTNFSPAVLAI